jgi:mevalonate kinase
MSVSSAPGKVYLFGEHAVVYGEPAIPCAIGRRATVSVERRDDERLRVRAPALSLDSFAAEFGDGVAVDADDGAVAAALGYVRGAVEGAYEHTGERVGLDVTAESDLPLGAGLGSSAAVVVATLHAAVRELGGEIGDDELAERAYRVEKRVQDGEASRADTFCATVGGAVRVEGESRERLDAPDLPLVVGHDGGGGNTGELVAGVRALKERYGFAADTVGAIGDVVRAGERALETGDTEELGGLMDFDHGLLSALGVSARSLDEMVWAARRGGAAGAKLTGAGGGGCVVALDPGGDALRALELTPACERAFAAPLDREGVCVE